MKILFTYIYYGFMYAISFAAIITVFGGIIGIAWGFKYPVARIGAKNAVANARSSLAFWFDPTQVDSALVVEKSS